MADLVVRHLKQVGDGQLGSYHMVDNIHNGRHVDYKEKLGLKRRLTNSAILLFN